MVRSPTVTLPGRAALWRREATFTVSPVTVYVSPTAPARTSPVLTPTRRSKSISGGEVLVDLLHGVLHPEAGADGALGVILVRDGRAEERHDVVADELVDGAAVALHLAAEPHQGTVDERLDRLRDPCAPRRRCSRTDRRTARSPGGAPPAAARDGGRPSCSSDAPQFMQKRASGERRRVAGGAAALEVCAAVHAEVSAGRVVGAAGGAAHRSRLELPLVEVVNRSVRLALAVAEAEALVERAGRNVVVAGAQIHGVRPLFACHGKRRLHERAAESLAAAVQARRRAPRGSTRARSSRARAGSGGPPAPPGRRRRGARSSLRRRSARGLAQRARPGQV